MDDEKQTQVAIEIGLLYMAKRDAEVMVSKALNLLKLLKEGTIKIEDVELLPNGWYLREKQAENVGLPE